MEQDINFQNLIKNTKIHNKIMVKGPTGAGKSTLLLHRYHHMVEEENIPSSQILILLLNRAQSLEWRSKTILKQSGAIFRTSYYGFIQSEIKTFYPIVQKNCSDIKTKRIKPLFLTFESSQYLLSKVIENKREKEGYFSGLTTFNDRIAIDLSANLVKAAISDISHLQIGQRLYHSLEHKDPAKKKVFEDADKITAAYRDKCLSLGIFDFGMAVSLYNQYLFPDQNYQESLQKRVRHLLVDNLEECVPTEVDFIHSLLPNLSSAIVGFNPEGGYNVASGANYDYVLSRLHDKFWVMDLENSYTCSPHLYEFSEMLFDTMALKKQAPEVKKDAVKKWADLPCFIERNPPHELRSDMLEAIGERIVKLVQNEGYKPCDITVLSTYSDPVTEYVISSILEKQGIGVKNMIRKSRVIENPFSYALVTLARICHPQYGIMPRRDDVKALLGLILNIDPIRSSVLSGEIVSQRPFASFPDLEFPNLVERVGYGNVEKYQYIRGWIEEYKSKEPLQIHEFLQKVFLELLIHRDVSQNDIMEAKNLIDSAKTFVEIMQSFARNGSQDFLIMLGKGIKGAESIFELSEKGGENLVLLSTPTACLSSSIQSKVMILGSLSSENWFPRNNRELTNNKVLTKTWDESSVYTEVLEEEKQKSYVAMLLRALIKRCSEKLITYESTLSSSGFENTGYLSVIFDEMLGG